MTEGTYIQHLLKKMWVNEEAPKDRNTKLEVKKEPPKGDTQFSDLVYYSIKLDILCHIILSIIESTEKVGFDYNVSAFVVDNLTNTHI